MTWLVSGDFVRCDTLGSEQLIRPGEFNLRAAATALLIGGVPFKEPVCVWWNFVARHADGVSQMWRDWASGDERDGRVDSRFARSETSAPVWTNRRR